MLSNTLLVLATGPSIAWFKAASKEKSAAQLKTDGTGMLMSKSANGSNNQCATADCAALSISHSFLQPLATQPQRNTTQKPMQNSPSIPQWHKSSNTVRYTQPNVLSITL